MHDEFYLNTDMGEMVDGHWGILPTGVETYTDSDGYYTFPDLDAGLYNVAVFHEDQYLRTIVHRSSSDGDDLTQTVPLAGLDGFVLEASGIKDGNCTLVWSGESLQLADRGSSASFLKGVGFGFREKPVLLIEPAEGNTGQGTLELDVSLSGEGKDGRLDLWVKSAAFHDRGDKYYIRYAQWYWYYRLRQ